MLLFQSANPVTIQQEVQWWQHQVIARNVQQEPSLKQERLLALLVQSGHGVMLVQEVEGSATVSLYLWCIIVI